MQADARLEKGMKIRSAVLGQDHVNRSMNQSDPFMLPIQQLVTEYCWGEIWGRPGLDRRSRSIINLALLSALNRSHELELHVRGALNNGVTPAEIQEVLLQVAIYCGVPAGLEATRIAARVIGNTDAAKIDK
jgi:4-carboxymuconolactone decarboxylase